MTYKHLNSLLFSLSMLLVGQSVVAESPWFVLMHSPGLRWDQSLSFFDQVGIEQHSTFMSDLLEAGDLVMGGPFLDNSGGMAILKVESIDAALAIANRDPAVQAGILKVDVKSWITPLSRMSVIKKRKAIVSMPKDAPFKLKSPSSDAPINIEDE
jgi:uncharacterized protein YciI